MVRKADDSSFIYALVSSDGNVRLDAVFNGDPRTLVPWIPCPWAVGTGRIVFDLVARGSRYLVLVNGRLALETEDDTLASGGLAFAAQSYDAPASTGLLSFSVESRPLEVEVEYLRYARVVAADSGQRRALAEGLFTLGHHVAALVQLRKVQDRGESQARDRFLEAECLMRLELYDEAAAALDTCLSMDPAMEEAIEERYNLLYLRGHYLELREALESDAKRLEGSPRLLNLLGHAWYNLGSWGEAASAYKAAVKADGSMPIYARNQAAALERSGDLGAASGAWLAAAQGFYAQSAWEDARECSARLRELGYDRTELDSLDGLIAYGSGDEAAAEALLAKAYRHGKATAPAMYVHGLLLAQKGKDAEAIRAFAKAAELEPGVHIYRYRLAEAKFNSGVACGPELDAALASGPDDGWTLNLAGQAGLHGGDTASAAALFARAAAALPDEAVPAVNLSHSLELLGRSADAVKALGTWPSRNPAAANQLGNLLLAQGKAEEATRAFEAACTLDPSDPDLPDFQVNLAAVLFGQGRYSEAEDYLRKVLERGDDARAMALMGDIASGYGDVGRAEVSYRGALGLEPGNTAILCRLADHYLDRRRYDQADKIAVQLEALDPARAARIHVAVRAATTETLACASCGRTWEIPRPVPDAKRATLRGEPPDDSPAGSCPSCGTVFCVACRKDAIEDGRFTCPDCGERLNLNDDRVRWLVLKKTMPPNG
jgi:tetratricopeptide (TPR) repeat protein